MELRKEPGQYYVERYVSKTNFIEFGISPVIFGMRINISVVGSLSIERSYCAGADKKWVELVYSLVKNIALNSPEDMSFIDSLPVQHVKPAINDPVFLQKLHSMVTEPLIIETLPPVLAMRERYFAENKF